ncbi:MAG: response regulator transcription factor, partial [Chloroflexota bacterium]|nr:response regulator transcription factor [Chloroflexota bacterium]
MDVIRVLVIDDHTIVRYGIIELLAKAPDIEVVGNASDGPEALHLVETERPDVILLDIRMPQMGGVEVARRVRATNRDVRVLALSASTEEEYICEMMAAGAAGYLTKDDELNEIAKAVRAVARGEVWVS